MSDTATALPQPYKKRRFGRPDVPRPLAGLDMRSQEAKVFVARLKEVAAEYPDGEPSRLREIAGLRVALEQVQLEVLKGNGKAREDLVRISNLISRRENELQTRRAATAPIDPRPLHERLRDTVAKPSGGRAGEVKASAGRGIAATRIERISAARREATNAIPDDDGDGDG